MKSGYFLIACWFALAAGTAVAQTATDVQCAGCVGTGDIRNKAVTTTKIRNGAVTAGKLADNAVTGGKILNGSVKVADLEPDLRQFLASSVTNLTVTGADGSGVNVAAADCPEDSVAISASCACDDEDGSRNFGVLFYCATDPLGAVAGCFSDAGTYDPQLPEPAALVLAQCMGAESLDGSPWLPGPAGLAPASPEEMNSAEGAAERAAWMKVQRDRYESLQRDVKAQAERRNSRLR